ncbi:TonB-dependent receptor [Simiduia litorea]|uniref:TonB-dependent receptor n=1 Tax=Simiduia litorea TaxID=1435348 RepID=UPI0036F27903
MKSMKEHNLSPTRKFPLKNIALGICLAAGYSSVAVAQEKVRTASSTLLEEIVVTARKKAESAQDAPLSVTAVGEQQLQALKVRNLTNLSVGLPNVAMDDAGTTKGTANFSIRGLGINSSIPSIDPTVGIFVDGVYMGVNNGIIFDTFDLASIEILRGPQGILFGRNVTGGAVLINTKKPTQETEATIRTAVEGGGEKPNSYLMASVSGGITESLAGKLVAYYNDDQGWFKNSYNDEAFGGSETKMARVVLAWEPSEQLDATLRYEHYEQDASGPAAQSHTNGSGVDGAWDNFDRDEHDFSVNEEGFYLVDSDLASLEINWEIGIGTLTNIAGWRQSSAPSRGDIDASPLSLFHSDAALDAEQFSNELRYNAQVTEDLDVTTGIYYFTNELNYQETRSYLNGASTLDGGGNYTVDTAAIFLAADYSLTESLMLTLGGRYTEEKKEAEIATLTLNSNNPCSVLENTCTLDFVDDESWSNFSPKVGLTYFLSADTMVYTSLTRGQRSGGYNLRNTSITEAPGPFDAETVDSFEIGFKSDQDNKLRINGAVFYNRITDMQREINLSDPFAGVVQVIRNTADATIMGMELDGTYALTESFVLNASVGLTDAGYDKLFYDLNGDGVIDDADKSLDLPRAAKLTYSVGINHDLGLGSWGYMSSRLSFGFRDASAYTDNNLGTINKQEILNAGVDFHSNDEHWVLGLYANNLLNSVNHGGDTQLPAVLGPVPLGGSFAPLSKGRTYGVDLTYNF